MPPVKAMRVPAGMCSSVSARRRAGEVVAAVDHGGGEGAVVEN